MQYESLSVFHKYNKIVTKEYQKAKDIFNKLNKYAMKLEKSIDAIVKKPFLGFYSQGIKVIEFYILNFNYDIVLNKKIKGEVSPSEIFLVMDNI